MSTCRIWQVPLGEGTADWALGVTLNEAERERAQRLRFDVDRQRFIRCRSALRILLGRELSIPPSDVPLVARQPYGRPELAAPYEGTLAFNVTHSDNLALIAFAPVRCLGIDVELLRQIRDVEGLAERYLRASERGFLELESREDRDSAFLTCWTRKEAVLKSVGTGLSVEPTRFEAGFEPEPRKVSIEIEQELIALDVWSFTPANGYIAACAIAPQVDSTELMTFDSDRVEGS